MREWIIKLLYFTLPADRKFLLRAVLTPATIDEALEAQDHRVEWWEGRN